MKRTSLPLLQRRQIIAGLGAAAAWPLAAWGQERGQLLRLGVLMSLVSDDPGSQPEAAALKQGLAELGWVDGRNIDVAFRWPGADLERTSVLAKELIALKPDVLLARSTPTTEALRRESGMTPIVFVNISEPLEQGFVQDFARPGGNITGFTNFDSMVGGKWLQLLKEVDPRIQRVAVIYNPQTAPFAKLYLRSVEASAPGLAIEPMAMPVASDAEIEIAMKAFAQQLGGGLIAIPDSFTGQHRDLIIEQAARNRLPALYANPLATPSGALISYAVDTRDLMRRAAGYIDRILKGAKPAALPVEEPTKFELAINLKTAKVLAPTIPPTLLATADEVIE